MRNQWSVLLLSSISLFMMLWPVHIRATPPPRDQAPPSQQTVIWHKAYRHIDPKTGYRTAYYRARVPNTVPGGTRISFKQVLAHYREKTARFVDVMAHIGTGPDPLDGTWRLAQPRKNIPGSLWLPDVGTGTISKTMENYFKSNLAKLTNNNKNQAIIIYCTADCWMAWNAVRRAASFGYTNILWYPEGTEDWLSAGQNVENSIPVPLTLDE